MAPLAPGRKEGVPGHTGSRSIQGSLKHNIRGEDAPPKEINCIQTMDSPGIALASYAFKTPLCCLTGQATLPRGISGALHPTEIVVVIPEEQTHTGEGDFARWRRGRGTAGPVKRDLFRCQGPPQEMKPTREGEGQGAAETM